MKLEELIIEGLRYIEFTQNIDSEVINVDLIIEIRKYLFNKTIDWYKEKFEDIIFLKDGKISLNVTIDMKNQLQSILKYFTENFLPFLTEDEKDFIEEEMNNDADIKSYISEKDKMKSNQSLKSVKRIKNGDDN